MTGITFNDSLCFCFSKFWLHHPCFIQWGYQKRASSYLIFFGPNKVNLHSVRVAVIVVLPWERWKLLLNAKTHLYLAYSLTFLHIIIVRSGQTWIEMKFLLLTCDQSLILSSFMYILFLRDALIFPLDAKKLRFIFVLHSFMQIYRSSSAESRVLR